MVEPQSKKRGGGDDEKETDKIIAFGGPMYDEATARKMLKEVVLVSAEYAEDGEAVIGFDPADEALDDLYIVFGCSHHITPMIYFARKGDAKMCRYLVSRGASTTKCSKEDYLYKYPLYPMFAAAKHGYLDICKLLYEYIWCKE